MMQEAQSKAQRRGQTPRPSVHRADLFSVVGTLLYTSFTGGLPVHIAAAILGHDSLDTTQSYTAVFQDDLIRSYRAFVNSRRAPRPAVEYREPTDEEWREFQQHFELRKVETRRMRPPTVFLENHQDSLPQIGGSLRRSAPMAVRAAA